MIQKIIKSPFGNCNAILRSEQSTLMFRDEEYSYMYSYYECHDTHERFTTTELDETNLAQVYEQYRAKYGNRPEYNKIKEYESKELHP